MAFKRPPAYVAALKVQFTILCIFGSVLAAYYFFYVTLHRNYLIERDFRLLATIGDQIVESIESQRTVIGNLTNADARQPGPDPENGDGSAEFFDFINRHVAYFVPTLRSAVFRPNPNAPKAFTLQLAEPESRFQWVERQDPLDRGVEAGVVRLELRDLLEPLLSGGRGVFDAMLVTDPDGRVIYQSGEGKLRMAHLDRLTRRTDPKAGEFTFQDLARAPSLAEVVVSGADYKLLTQPCCARMIRTAGSGSEAADTKAPGTPPAAAPATPPARSATSSGDGWVLCGLVATGTLSSDSYAVSFSTLILLCGMLLLGLLSWPFLKLTLLGESQRVKAYDVVLVGFATLVGLSLLTIGALDYIAYGRQLTAILDEQLRTLATDIDKQAAREVQRAEGQLETLQDAVLDLRIEDADLTRSTALFRRDGLLREYPYFESFSLIDDKGMQRQKLTLGSISTLFVSADDREYFTNWASTSTGSHVPVGDTAANKYFIEAIRSKTTGVRQAVISTRSRVEKFRVAALSMPLRALIEPVLVPGFGFAVIDDDGRVLFHSDEHHNLSENFFLESDNSRRLRALVNARHSEWVDVQYWGDDHRALVSPMSVGQRWTLITFYDKDLVRAVNVEWVILALALLALYIGTYAVVTLGVLFARPTYRAPWLWPDANRSREYVDLLPPLVLLAGAFALATLTLPIAELLEVAWLLPCLTWTLIYYALADSSQGTPPRWLIPIGVVALGLLLVVSWHAPDRLAGVALMAALISASFLVVLAQARRATTRGRPLPLPVNVSFGLLAGFALTITTVLPATAFFKVGHAIQLENFVKYGQLNAASARIRDDRRDQETQAKDLEVLRYEDWSGLAERSLTQARAEARQAEMESGLGGAGVYQRFFFTTRPFYDLRPAGAVACPSTLSSQSDPLPGILEEFLPFYSELSVPMREMVHDQADDQQWIWRHSGADLVFCAKDSAVDPFQSSVPPLFAATAAGGVLGDRVSLLILLGLLAGAVVWLVRFTLHKVFVIDVIEPLWSGKAGSLDTLWASNLFLVSGGPISDELDTSRYCEVDLTLVPKESSEQARWFEQQLARIEQSPSGQNVLIRHFEHRLQDVAIGERKLAFLERVIDSFARTVVIVSTVPPGRFFVKSATATTTGRAASPQQGRPQRWARVLSNFTIVPVIASSAAPEPTPVPALDWMTAGWREVLWRINALGFSHSASFLDDERRDAEVGRVWKDVLPYAWHPDRALTVDQLLTEVGDRSQSHYHQIWESCTPAEKLVLGQIAAEGLVNGKTKRTVRMLMVRRLVRRQPNFVLLNESFRQFVLSASSRAEVTTLEQESSSTWDAVRAPFMILLIGSLAFFFATQQELFNTALGIVTGVAATLPALMKMLGLFGTRKEASQ